MTHGFNDATTEFELKVYTKHIHRNVARVRNSHTRALMHKHETQFCVSQRTDSQAETHAIVLRYSELYVTCRHLT